MKIETKFEKRISKAGNEYFCVVIYVDNDELEVLMISRPTQALLKLTEKKGA